jgi:hypothetical protein
MKEKKTTLHTSPGHLMIKIISNLSMTVCFLKMSKSLQTKFAATAHLAEGQFLKDRLTWINS